MTAAEVVANQIRSDLTSLRIPSHRMTPDDVCLMMLEYDEFLALPGPKAMAVSADILEAWRNESSF